MTSLAMKFYAVAVVFPIIFNPLSSFAVTQVVPTTTLAAQTGNNTSTSPSFGGTTNGNISGKNNISKVSATTLLYPGATTKIYAHLMAWFGGSGHMNVGYASDDPAQVTRQVNDMLSRGLSGAIIDWYGPNNARVNDASLYVKQEAEKHSNFDFAIMEDVGALKPCGATSGCDVTGRMIKDLVYAYNTFEESPAYMRVGTRPVVFFFGVDAYALDWARVRNGVPGNPIFVFRNNSGFTHSQSGGSFSWEGLSSDPNNMGLGYLDSFYSTGNKYPSLQSVGSSYKGFDDSIASWGSNRLLNQQCGQTWLKTMAEAGKYFSTSNQLDSMQLVTWNDYEEGTALETGINNCVSVSASLSGSTLGWTLSGQANTVDHFTIFISLDGVNLMRLATVANSSRALDLSTFSLASGAYKFFVQAVGKPFLTNKMSGAVSYSTSTLPTTTSVSISSPGNNTTVSNTPTVSGKAISSVAISLMQIYVDGVKSYEVAGSSVTKSVSVSAGSHRITVQAVDNAGGIAKATINVTAN
jgi:Bacterial Ig domain